MKKIILFSFFILLLLILTGCKEPSFEETQKNFFEIFGVSEKLNFSERREDVLSELNLAIEEAEEEGRYKCCIEPACTMCYLGNWIWEDGSCYCDDMIANGEMDKVCPQCVRGIEEGSCKSTSEFCDTESGENFKSI